ncbi:sensor histidine kinase [Cohnella cellulosilytica]|uniref:histidine kinase n=1 Tax=Cohnella cellulosilytica TaxID=986710 RepID=A0ABW2F4N7_9BACL
MADSFYRKASWVLVVLQTLVFLMLWEEQKSFLLSAFAAGYTLVYALYNFVLIQNARPSTTVVYVIVQLSLATGVVILEGDFLCQSYLFILLAEIAFLHALRYGVAVTLLCYAAFAIGHWIHYEFPPFGQISYVIPRAMEYATFFGLSYMAKTAFLQKQRLSHAYERLAEYSVELEQKALMQERTRLSREIHDTVGHTLTSAITGLQTAIRLMDKEPAVATDMIHQTKSHIQEGLQEIRRSVHVLDADAAFPDFVSAMRRLLEDTRRQTGVAIEAELEPSLPRLDPKAEMTFYRALQEGLTNGIRHGGASRFVFRFVMAPDHILFELENDGSSWRSQPYGFGLSAMHARVTDIRGTLTLTAGKHKRGTRIRIALPFKSNKEE